MTIFELATPCPRVMSGVLQKQ